MKTFDRPERVTISQPGEVQQFQIKASAKAFRILSSGLYGNKIKAIIRELSTNAADSHVMAGCPTKPFDVHFPTLLEPSFWIRDYGTGLSPDSIKTVYTVYFESDKTNSNDVTGCLGLGSKSPFSYTKQFVVESFFKGKKYTYSAFIAEDGSPSITLLDESTTSEENGLKITLAVSPKDIDNFKREGDLVYRYFKVYPNILGNKFDITHINYALHGKGWHIRERSFHGDCQAIMGNVAYPIVLTDSSINKFIKALIACKLDIEFNIGELDVEASREGLSYDKRTVNNILRRCDAIAKEIEQMLTVDIVKSDTLWEARVKFCKIMANLPKEITSIVDCRNIEWNGKGLFTTSQNSVYVEQLTSLGVSIFKFDRFSTRSSKRELVKYISPNENILFYYKDNKTGAYSRCIDFIHFKEANKSILLFEFTNPDVNPAVNAVCEIFGIKREQLLPTSSLPSPERVKGGMKNRKKNSKASIFVPSQFSTMCWKDTEIDLEQGGYYVEINRAQVKIGEKTHHPSILKNLLDGMEKLGYTKPVVYGFKTEFSKKVKDNPKWVNYIQYCKEELSKGKINVRDVIDSYYILRNSHIQPSIISIGKELNGNNPLAEYANYLDSLQEKAKDYTNAYTINMLLGLVGLTTHRIDAYKRGNIEPLFKKAAQRYPLINLSTMNNASEDFLKHVKLYINAVEGVKR